MIKSVMQAHYVHKSNIQELIEKKVPDEKKSRFIEFIDKINKLNINYTVIKYDKGNITLIYSSDWDTANEPLVDICYRWKENEWFDEDDNINPNYKTMKNGRQIYHNKWQFVSENYKGFDIKAAKQRTEIWNAIPNLNKSKIGNKTYWVELLNFYNIPV